MYRGCVLDNSSLVHAFVIIVRLKNSLCHSLGLSENSLCRGLRLPEKSLCHSLRLPENNLCHTLSMLELLWDSLSLSQRQLK